MLEFEGLTREILGGAIEVHRALGPGLLESAYEECLAHELISRGLTVERQVPLPVEYRGVQLDCAYRLDLVVDDAVILELKCVERVLPIHDAQLLTYLRLAQKSLGFILNFNTKVMKDGIHRRVLSPSESVSAISASPR